MTNGQAYHRFRSDKVDAEKDQKTIVYIEDERELIDLLALILRKEDIRFAWALTGEQGWELIKELQPDLVLLDLMLPDIDGWEVFNRMRQDPALRDTPVIVITVRTEGLTEGIWPQVAEVADYLVKPFTVKELRASIARALQGTEDRQQEVL